MNFSAELYQRLFVFSGSFVNALFFPQVPPRHPALPAHARAAALSLLTQPWLGALQLHLAPLPGVKDAENITAKMQVCGLRASLSLQLDQPVQTPCALDCAMFLNPPVTEKSPFLKLSQTHGLGAQNKGFNNKITFSKAVRLSVSSQEAPEQSKNLLTAPSSVLKHLWTFLVSSSYFNLSQSPKSQH